MILFGPTLCAVNCAGRNETLFRKINGESFESSRKSIDFTHERSGRLQEYETC